GMPRRTFVRSMAVAGASLLPLGAAVRARAAAPPAVMTPGDANILRFLAAAEILEADLWQQYNELAAGNADYAAALATIDDDMADYIEQNTDDEISHADFLNAYLVAKGKQPVNLDAFRTLPSSSATGAAQVG